LDSHPRRIALLMIDGRRRAGEHGIPLTRGRRARAGRGWIVVPRLGLEVRLRRGLVELGTDPSAEVESLL